MVFGLFKPKRKPVAIPLPPDELPSFPSPEELDIEDVDKVEQLREDLDASPARKGPVMSVFTRQSNEEPLFLRVESYQSILDLIGYTRNHLDRSGRMVARMEELHDGQKGHLNHIRDEVHEAHEKLLLIDSLLFKRG